MFNKILIPVDDSSCSKYAAEFGIELAKKLKAQIFIIHVTADLPTIYAATDWAEDLLEQGGKLLDTYRQNQENLNLKTLVVKSLDIAQGIIQSAHDRQCDLIVMGTHGRRGIAHAFLGSVAERVIRLSTLPVLLIRQPKADQHQTVSSLWQRIVVAIDGSEASRKALSYADQLAQSDNAELHLIHVIPDLPPPLVDPLGVGGMAAGFTYSDALKELEREARIVMEVAKAEIKCEKTFFHIARAQRESIDNVIVNYAKEKHCDLIVMGTHGRTGLNRLLLGSVAEALAHSTPIPLMLIHFANE